MFIFYWWFWIFSKYSSFKNVEIWVFVLCRIIFIKKNLNKYFKIYSWKMTFFSYMHKTLSTEVMSIHHNKTFDFSINISNIFAQYCIFTACCLFQEKKMSCVYFTGSVMSEVSQTIFFPHCRSCRIVFTVWYYTKCLFFFFLKTFEKYFVIIILKV